MTTPRKRVAGTGAKEGARDRAHPRKIVAYYRVSTRRQGESGLGLAAQKRAVEAYTSSIKARIVASYREVESGRKAKRPQLTAALADAKAQGARLVVAKLDRLARNVAFTAALLDSGVDFVACDQPQANRLTIHILAAVAEDEARRISERTKTALAEAKRRGKRIGWWGHQANRRKRIVPPRSRRLSPEQARRSIQRRNLANGKVNQRRADTFALGLQRTIRALQGKGLDLRRIAAELNRQKIRTSTGKRWTWANVSRVDIQARAAKQRKK